MKMFRSFMLAFSMLLAVPAMADSIAVPDVKSMSPEQITMLKAQIDAADKAPASAQSTAAKVSEWATVGKNISEGIVGAAKELGVEANAFAATPLGKTTVVVLMWHFFGKSLILFAMLFLIPLLFAPLVTYAVRRNFGDVKTDKVESTYFGVTRQRIVATVIPNDSMQAMIFSSYVVMFVVWCFCLANM
jgi:hypothetical protein